MVRILIVDDDEQTCKGLEEILLGKGYETISATSGEAAVKKLAKEDFDFVLTDLVMPRMSGMEVLREAKRINPKTHVIIITAFATIESAVEAMQQGASDYISKPFKLHEVQNTLKRILEESKFEEKLRQSANAQKLSKEYNLDIDAVIKSLSNPVRREIIELLCEHSKSRFTDIKEELGIEDATKLSFHLRTLKNARLVEQDSERVYSLCATGKKIMEVLKSIS
ncbi:MAG: response regulator [Euryarchaeota archaeon]|nr:response regulator [Euryarchaeota archaeon]